MRFLVSGKESPAVNSEPQRGVAQQTIVRHESENNTLGRRLACTRSVRALDLPESKMKKRETKR
jgi:hypothetical protein